MGKRPTEDQDPITCQRSGKTEIGRAAPQRQKQPSRSVKDNRVQQTPWVDANPAQPPVLTPKHGAAPLHRADSALGAGEILR